MKSNFKSLRGIHVAALAGVVLAGCLVTSPVKADGWDKTSFLTVNEPIQVSNTYLEPGTYMFKLANWDRHIVQIFNGDRSHLYNTVFAIPNYRLNVTGDEPIFTYWETPPGSVKAIRGWFWPGDHDGQEFTYPTNLRQVALVTTPAPAIAPQPPPPVASTAPEQQPAPAPQASTNEDQSTSVIIAQNNPPPPPAAAQPQEPAPAQPQSNESQSLPQTASPYPIIGLGGLFSLGLFLGLRVRQYR